MLCFIIVYVGRTVEEIRFRQIHMIQNTSFSSTIIPVLYFIPLKLIFIRRLPLKPDSRSVRHSHIIVRFIFRL